MDLVDALTLQLEAVDEVELAVLFGSSAAGSTRRGSDVDVAVRLRTRSAAHLASLTVVLERAVGRCVDLVPLDHAPPLLRFEIARAGRVLVDRTACGWADFCARAMLDWWDWAPTARRIHRQAVRRLACQVRDGAS